MEASIQYIDLMDMKSIGSSVRTTFCVMLVLLTLIGGGSCWCLDSEVSQLNTASSVDFAPDNQVFLATDSTANMVNFWRIDTKELIYTYTNANTPVSAKFSKLGNVVGVGLSNGDVVILNYNGLSGYTANTTLTNPANGAVVEIDFSWITANSMIVCSNSKIRFINYVTNANPWTINGNGTLFSCKLNKADGVGYSYGRAAAWNVYNSGSTAASNTVNGNSNGNTFFEVDFSMDTGTSMKLVSGNVDGNYYSLPNGCNNCNTNPFSVSNDGFAVCYSKDNNFFAGGETGGSSCKLYIYNTTGTSVYQKFDQSPNGFSHCRFSYDSTYLIASSAATSSIYIYSTSCLGKCRVGYYDNGTGVCLTCSTMIGCLTCSAATTCTSCVQGFYLNVNLCASCTSMSNCRSCESNSKCTECNLGFFLSNASNCLQCESWLKGCISCSRNYSNTTTTVVYCRSCHSEYFLSSTDSTCYPCSSVTLQCLRCFNSSACMQCQPGYYLDATLACQPCSTNCINCASSSSCQVCNKGYYSSGGTCLSCGTNCLDCYNSFTCISCAKGTFISAGACTACTSPCMTCSGSATSCLNCAMNYYPDGAGNCLTCISNCATCNSASNCSSCFIGYYLTSTSTCALCSASFQNCSTCNLAQCFSCQSSFYLNSTSNCQACQSSLTGCLTCSNSTACSQCFVGYYLSAGNCSPCAAQCESCTSASVCSSCAVGYYITAPTCTLCVAPCVTCSSSAYCLSCQTGYYLNASNVCVKCLLALIGCTACSSASTCIECELGRYLSGSSCLYCPANCSTCNATTCLACSVGYYLTGSTCSKCVQNCSECSSSSVCYSCNTGFYLNNSLASNNCLSCVGLGCETCNINGCLGCQVGYYLSSASCLTCNSSFANCLSCSESQCTQCLYGFYPNNGTCTLCFNALNGCVACLSNSVCIQCTAGYYLTGGSVCASCPFQCRTCLNNVCTSCQTQYAFNAGLTNCLLCESFMEACLTCSSNSICTTCSQGFYLAATNNCVPCRNSLIGCLSCANSTSCSVCQDQYYLAGGICTSCTSIQACSYCQNSSFCLSCLSGYYLNSNNTCSLCTVSLVGCVFCSSASTCRQCQTGYFLNSATNQCQMCINSIAGCLSCSNASLCLECDGGYYLDSVSFRCKTCNVTGCQVCGDSSPSVCISCSLGYYLTGSTCTACAQNGCLECSGAASCLRCDSGYYLSGSACSSCKSGLAACSKCVNGSVCTQCDSTYFLNSSQLCQACSDTLVSCQICSSSTYCTSCSSGYYSNGGVCTSCSSLSGCFMCLSASTCLSCVNGYYLSGSGCLTCASSLSNCYSCNNSTVCLSCLSGYILDASGVCNAVTTGTSTAPVPIPMLDVKTYYVSSTALKHVFYAKQGYKFSQQSLSWSSVTTISLYNSATSTTVPLTITSVEWGVGLTSIIFYTNNPLNLNADALSMPLARLLATQEEFSFSYQTKFQMTQAALELLMPDQVIPNDFTQQGALMSPSFYTSYLQNSSQYYFTIMGYVIVVIFFINFIVRATCTAPASRNIGEIVPHILALKTCALMVFPIYPQVASFCYGLMGADLTWLTQYYVPFALASEGDIQPAGFQLYFTNMNFASLFLTPAVLCLMLILLAYIGRSKPAQQQEVFTLTYEQGDQNRNSNAFMRVIFMFFSFGASMAGAASIQGALYNPSDYLSANGLFYMVGGIVFCVLLGVTVWLTRRQSRMCYLRSFLKGGLLSVAHISPIYVCTLAVAVDLSLVAIQMRRYRQMIKFPRVWLLKHTFANLSLLTLYYFNSKKLALLAVVAVSFLSVCSELAEHFSEGNTEEAPSKRVKPVNSEKERLSEHDQKNDTVQFFSGDIKPGKKGELLQPALGDTRTTFNNSNTTAFQAFVYDEEPQEGLPSKGKNSPRSQKRHRPFRAMQRKREVKVEPIMQREDSINSPQI